MGSHREVYEEKEDNFGVKAERTSIRCRWQALLLGTDDSTMQPQIRKLTCMHSILTADRNAQGRQINAVLAFESWELRKVYQHQHERWSRYCWCRWCAILWRYQSDAQKASRMRSCALLSIAWFIMQMNLLPFPSLTTVSNVALLPQEGTII